MSSGTRRSRDFVRWTLRHGRALWVASALVSIPAFAVTARLYLHLNSDIEQLLPLDSPSVLALDELRSRMKGLQHLGVVVDARDAAHLPAAERLIDDLAARVKKYPTHLVRRVSVDAEPERRFIEKHAALYADLQDLVTVKERIVQHKRWELSSKLDILLDDTPPPPLDFDDIAKKYENRAGGKDRFTRHRFSSVSPAAALLLIEVGGFSTGTATAQELTNRIKHDIIALGGTEHYAPGAGMRFGFTGDLAVSLEEISALEGDLTVASLLVVAAVFFVILVYFRWWRCVPILFIPLVVAAAWAFALATLPPWRVRELNSNTAFLGSIIAGNGINFGIVLLARYVEARRRGEAVEDALVEAVGGARLGTLVAALAAGASYASLIITEFRGFRQFGVIGGLGMLLCWGASFLLMPPLIAWLDRGGKTAPRPLPPSAFTLTGPLARAVARWAAPVAGVGVLVTVLSAFTLPSLNVSRLETDFSRLRRRDTWDSGEGFWGKKMDLILGHYLSPTVILADSRRQAEAIADSLRKKKGEAAAQGSGLQGLVAEIRSYNDVVPPNQEAKQAEIAAIRRMMTPATRAEISGERLAKLDQIIGDGPPGAITEADLPPSFLNGLREIDGQIGRAVLVFPALDKATWQGDKLAAFVGDLRRIIAATPLADGERPARIAGGLPISADITTSIRRDGPLASALAFAGVVVLILAMFRWSRYTILVAGSLLVGVLWLTASVFLLGVKINFVNFIAFPITFGIGVDYAVNVMSRYVQDGSRDVQGPIRSTGAAVGLCSMTTIVGYSSLLLAKNQGLFLFGLVAVLGEIMCLVTALALLPAVLLLWPRRGAPLSNDGDSLGATVAMLMPDVVSEPMLGAHEE